MNKYKVLQSFTFEGEEFAADSEVELTDEKAAAIGTSYLAKIEAGAGSEAQPAADAGSEAAGQTDTPPAGEGQPSNEGEGTGEKGEEQTA